MECSLGYIGEGVENCMDEEIDGRKSSGLLD
jgi:hypothetical protein